MLRILVSVATYIGILNTIITILYSHRQGRNNSILIHDIALRLTHFSCFMTTVPLFLPLSTRLGAVRTNSRGKSALTHRLRL